MVREPLSEIWDAWKRAKENSHQSIDSPMPYGARLYIARQHNLAPDQLLKVAEEDQSKFPEALQNKVFEVVEDEYGLNPGIDDFEVSYKEKKQAEFLAIGGREEKGDEVKRMLATLDVLEGK